VAGWFLAGLAGAGQFRVAKADLAGAGEGEFEPHVLGVGGDLRGYLVPGPVAAAGDGLAGALALAPDTDPLMSGGCAGRLVPAGFFRSW
jgi:hypothetical protein